MSRAFVSAVGGLLAPDENRKSWLSRIAKRAGLSVRVVSAAFYGEQMSDATERRLKIAARSEANELAAQLEQITRSMSVADADFFASDIVELDRAARRLRGLDRAGDS